MYWYRLSSAWSTPLTRSVTDSLPPSKKTIVIPEILTAIFPPFWQAALTSSTLRPFNSTAPLELERFLEAYCSWPVKALSCTSSGRGPTFRKGGSQQSLRMGNDDTG